MCGIVGIIGKETANKDVLVRDMAACIKHRGPDEDGFFDDDYVSLGMRRLSIIDLSGGTQPISSADDNLLIFFNGEIYNYKELRGDLEKKGYAFKTDSDTETILHLYEAYGKAGLTQLRGMFTFCIYDKKGRTLFFARDFFGIKPFYYFKQNDSVLGFASEIKALLLHPKMQTPGVLEVNDEALYEYLRFQYNPLEETFFKNIYSLRPGHCMTIDLLSGTHEIERYWHMDFLPSQTQTPQKDSPDTKEDRLAEKIRETMKDSVAHHMIADVPVGSFLSGGVDSSINATLMQQIRHERGGEHVKVKTFTVGFKELSEGAEAKETSDMLGTDHHEIIVSPEEYFSVLPKLVWHFDEPVADPSAIALYFVSREARKHVTVVLSGEGADELFGGYNIYRAPYAYRKMLWLPQWVLKTAANLPFPYWGKNYLRRVQLKLSEWYIGNASIFSTAERARLWKGERGNVLPPILSETYDDAAATKLSDSTTMQLVDINTWMVGDILAKADKMTMANSLELRVPFLDTAVAALARTIPDELKWKNGQTKYILRKAFEKIIPQNTARRRKLGFPTPIRAWLGEESNKESKLVYETIRTSPLLNSRLDMSAVESIIHEQASGKTDNSRKVYLLYMLALWHKVFFEKM